MIIGTVRPEEARIFDDYAGYHTFHAEDTQEPYGSFEVFWTEKPRYPSKECEDAGEELDAGWYWQACFPGCLPDGEPSGPFASSRQALEDADEWNPEFDEVVT
jgi:hypothetical protein